MIETALVLIALGAVLTIIRMLLGPTSFDRLLASDTLAVMAVAFLAVLSTGVGGTLYIDVAIVYGIIGFVGVVVIARFLQGVRR